MRRAAGRRLLVAGIVAVAVVAAAPRVLALPPDRATPGPERSARYAALLVTLDELVARARPDGGWTFGHLPGRRFRPHTSPLRFAEWLARPFGRADWDVVVLRSPGTPAAILSLLAGHRLTGRERYLETAVRAGDLLVAIQMPSGGWFSEMPVRGGAIAGWFRWTVRRSALDDDITPGAVRALLGLWESTHDPRYRTAAERGLGLLLERQLPGGAWPLVARPYWKQWLYRDFEDRPTLNDGATTQAIVTLLTAARVLGREDLLAAARRGGDWIIGAQRAAPQAGWAQQYDENGHPAPARRYERIALASWESRYALDALVALTVATGDQRYCGPVTDAVRWLVDARLGPDCWARFYELGSNQPLYFNEKREVVESPAAAHQPYDWTGDFGIPYLLLRLGVADGTTAADDGGPLPAAASPRLPGDPGGCPDVGRAPLRSPHRRRSAPVIAYAARLLAALEPPPSACTVKSER